MAMRYDIPVCKFQWHKFTYIIFLNFLERFRCIRLSFETLFIALHVDINRFRWFSFGNKKTAREKVRVRMIECETGCARQQR